MKQSGRPYLLGGALLFAAGAVVGALAVSALSRPQSDSLGIGAPSPMIGTPTNSSRDLKPPAASSQVTADVPLNPDREPPKRSGGAVIAIGPPMDVDAEFFSPSSTGSETIVRIGEPHDVDTPP